ncbi:transposase [Thiolapillus sp.]|uniref:transposase n=1 Tax=Thiolapillus sp. TaxID=2017437 RepID=UPI003AF49DDE
MGYVLGLARNKRLQRALGKEMEAARLACERTGETARCFRDFRYRTRKSWSCERRVIGKAEYLPGKANPRFVVTRCQPWRAKRRLVVPSSREAALFSRRALRQRENKVGLRTRRPVIGSQVRSSNELAKLLRSAW